VRITPRLAAVLLAAGLALAGCDRLFGPPKSPFQGIDVTGGEMGGELRLTGHDGKPRSLADFRGKVVVISFGFTHCPDVCPTTLADLAAAVKQLGGEASQVQVLFVTVDPKRDTPELLRQYVPAFHPDFIGLTGDEAALERARKEFHVYAQVRAPKPGEEAYSVDHSAHMYVVDRQGKLRLLLPPGSPPAAIAADLRVLLNNA
jgi:protein SCO1/2